MSTPFTSLRQQAQKRLDLLDQLEEALRADPGFGDMLRQALGGASSNVKVRAKTGRPRDPKHLELFVGALKGGGWISTPAIRKATGLSKSQISGVVKAYADSFESQADPENRRRLQWKAKAP